MTDDPEAKRRLHEARTVPIGRSPRPSEDQATVRADHDADATVVEPPRDGEATVVEPRRGPTDAAAPAPVTPPVRSPTPSRPPRRRRTIGRYELLAKVGAGTGGTVYRAQDPTIRRVVALKVIPVEASDLSPGASADFFAREAEAAGSLLHPNIVALHDAGRDGDSFYLAMEFVEGGTFAAEIARHGSVPAERAIEVGAVVAEALDFAHERGVVHRDVKPANLMVLQDGTVKVADFGIARLTTGAATISGGAMVGTPYYMSPEQVQGGTVDGRSDVYSLGAVLYEALTGRKPFQADGLPALLSQILTSSPCPPHQIDPSIPVDLGDIVLRAMARDPARRPARGKDLARELRALATGGTDIRTLETSRGGPSRPPEPARAEPMVGLGRAAVIAALVLAAAAAAGWGVWRLREPDVGFAQFTSKPPGAEVLLDGQAVGRTPYTLEASEGTHEVELRKDGYFPAQATINIPARGRVPVELELVPRTEAGE